MRTSNKAPRRASPGGVKPNSPKDVAESLADRAPYDRIKSQRTSKRAVQAADRLLKEMDDVLKHLQKKN